MLKNSLNKESKELLVKYPELETFLPKINNQKEFTLLSKIVEAHKNVLIDVTRKSEDILYALGVLTKSTLKESVLELQNGGKLIYSKYLSIYVENNEAKLFQRAYQEGINKLYDAGEPYEHLVYSSFPYFILQVDPYLTILTLPSSVWLLKHREELDKVLYKMRVRQRSTMSKEDEKVLFIHEKTGASISHIKQVRYTSLLKLYLVTKHLNMTNLSSGDFLSALDNLKLKHFEKVKEDYVKKVLELYPNLEEFSYKNLVDKYFGINLDESKNAPKLSKQLSKAKVEYTNRELIAFGELKQLLESYKDGKSSLGYGKKTGILFVDTKDFNIPDFVDHWAFAESCNNSRSGAGSETHLVCRDLLGMSYLKIYGIYFHEGVPTLSPAMRAYFKKDGAGHIAHAGGYSDFYGNLDHTAYDAWSAIFSTLFERNVDEFRLISGVNLRNDSRYNSEERHVRHYSNMSEFCSYKKLGTRNNILSEIIPDEKLGWKQVENISAVKDLPNYSSDAVNIKNYTHEIKL